MKIAALPLTGGQRLIIVYIPTVGMYAVSYTHLTLPTIYTV